VKKRLRNTVDVWVDLFAEHDLLTYASAIAFRTFIGLVAISLLALGVLDVAGLQSVWRDHLGPAIEPRVLLPVYAGIDATVERIFESSGWSIVAAGSALAVWDVASAVRACMGGLNRIYDAKDDRPFWIRFPLSLGLAVVIIVGVIGAFLLLVAARGIGSGAAGPLLAVARFAAAILLLGLAIGVLVRFAPAERRAKKWATVGTTLVVVAWLVTSIVFKWYVTSVANFKSAVGTLAVFFVLTAYLYTSAIVFLVGVQLDELLRRGTNEQTVIDLVRSRF
jgi:membrane protein